MNSVFLNGTLVPAESAQISIFDRGFLYGDGLFETVRVQSGKLFRWTSHLSRLEEGSRVLGIRPPHDQTTLTRHALELIAVNKFIDGVLRVSISRGTGSRGYSPAGAGSPTVAMSLHTSASPGDERGRRLITSKIQVLAGDPLAAIKSASKLHYVLARAEADAAGVDDALLLNHRGEIAETTSSNLFWMKDGILCTPPAEVGLLPGIARGIMLGLAGQLRIPTDEKKADLGVLAGAESVFVTNVVSGPKAVSELDGREMAQSDQFEILRQAFAELVRAETS